MKSVGVVGAGITGLVAAFELATRGVPVTVYESAGRVGGVIGTVEEQGFIVERGPNTILETNRYFPELIQRVGLESQRIFSALEAENRYIARNGKLEAVPSKPAQFLTSNLFSAGAKARLFAEPFVKRAPAEADETVSQFVLRRLGREFLDYAINPMIAGIYAGDPERLSIKEGFPKLHSLEQEHGSILIGQFARGRELRAKGEVSKQNAPKFSFIHGLQALPDAIARALGSSVRLNTSLVGVARSGAEWRLKLRSEGKENDATHDHILVTCPAYRLPEIDFQFAGAGGLRTLAEIPYAGVATLGLGFKREQIDHPLNGFGALIPAVERLSILGALFSSSLFPNRAPSGSALLTCYIGGKRHPHLVEAPLEQQVELACRDLQRLIGLRGAPTYVHRTVYPRGIPQYEIGYGRFRTSMEQIEQQAPGLHLGGNYRGGIALGDSILNGRNFAEKIAVEAR